MIQKLQSSFKDLFESTNFKLKSKTLILIKHLIVLFSTNSTFITADFRGLGLPTTSYNIFTNLMDIISIGQANCLKTQGGLCVLP